MTDRQPLPPADEIRARIDWYKTLDPGDRKTITELECALAYRQRRDADHVTEAPAQPPLVHRILGVHNGGSEEAIREQKERNERTLAEAAANNHPWFWYGYHEWL